jgi:hypothetical protein
LNTNFIIHTNHIELNRPEHQQQTYQQLSWVNQNHLMIDEDLHQYPHNLINKIFPFFIFTVTSNIDLIPNNNG